MLGVGNREIIVNCLLGLGWVRIISVDIVVRLNFRKFLHVIVWEFTVPNLQEDFFKSSYLNTIASNA